jgi:uncharacterized repeat protein (TIGR01451 family)
MQMLAYAIAAAMSAASPVAISPLQVSSSVLVEQRSTARDGTSRVAFKPATRVTPGDRLIFALDYRNTGQQPLAGVVFDNRVPAGLAYRAALPGSIEPLLSVDGKVFGPLGTLRVAGRPAILADVTHVRWTLAAPIAPGGSGRLSFAAVLK